MGQEYSGKRKHLLFCLAGCLIFAGLQAGGCVYPPEKWGSEEHLARSVYLLEKGQFSASLAESEEALKIYPQLLGDQALLQIGLIHAHPRNPEQSNLKAKKAFQTLIREYPDSDLKIQAEMWISAISRLQDAEKQLDAQKDEITRLGERLGELRAAGKKRLERHRKDLEARNRKIKALEGHIKELEKSIDQLKEIDLKIEEKKREATP